MDIVGGAHLYQGYNVEFVKDRFGNPNSAIRISWGFYKIPPGVYFNGDFTIAVWIKLNFFSPYRNRILFFGKLYGGVVDNRNVLFNDHYLELIVENNKIGIGYSYDSINSFSGQTSLLSSSSLTLGEWTFIVATLSGTTASLYINGIQSTQCVNNNFFYIPFKKYRETNYIGPAIQYLDDLRIYDRALSQFEIYALLYNTSDFNRTNFFTNETNKPTCLNENENFK